MIEAMVKNDHPAFFPPKQNCTLRRYVDVTKLLSVLETRTLHFARVDQLPDPYEGRLSKAIVQKLRDSNQFPKETIDMLLEGTEKFRSQMFVNCWCASDDESAAMWRLYLQSDEGVAIITDHETLLSALAQSPLVIRTSLIQYADFRTTLVPIRNVFDPFLYKRLSFSHERELRAIIWAQEDTNIPQLTKESVSVKVEVDPKVLVKAIHVSPSAPMWFGELIEGITRRYDLACPVVRSDLYDRPTY